MVSDTKKKRGRPKLPGTITAEMIFTDKETRAAQNMYYAGALIHAAGYDYNSFFVTGKGNFRRQGIAEQIGRMLIADLITIKQAKELAQEAEQDYRRGKTVKEIASMLAFMRQSLAAETRAKKKPNSNNIE